MANRETEIDSTFDRVENIIPDDSFFLDDEPGINKEKIDENDVFGTVEVGGESTTTIPIDVIGEDVTINTLDVVINGKEYTLLIK